MPEVLFSGTEFEALLESDKTIDGDIPWTEDEDHSTFLAFRADVGTPVGYPLVVKGSYNPSAGTLSYSLIHRGVGRIYGLDLGKAHQNPDRSRVGERHKHRWDEQQRGKFAYVPPDITAEVTDPVKVWDQFCAEAAIRHNGTMRLPPPNPQMGLWDR